MNLHPSQINLTLSTTLFLRTITIATMNPVKPSNYVTH